MRDLVEEECGIEIIAERTLEAMCESSHPVRLYVNGELVMEGLPGEEGYLIEALKKLINECKERKSGD